MWCLTNTWNVMLHNRMKYASPSSKMWCLTNTWNVMPHHRVKCDAPPSREMWCFTVACVMWCFTITWNVLYTLCTVWIFGHVCDASAVPNHHHVQDGASLDIYYYVTIRGSIIAIEPVALTALIVNRSPLHYSCVRQYPDLSSYIDYWCGAERMYS